MEVVINAIKMHLKTQFEQELFDAAIANLEDVNNVLRLNNFAYSMRELTRHFLRRLAPDEDVLQAPWFESEDKDNPKAITRAQRIRYAIQGWISEEFADQHLKLNVNEISKNLRNSINDLSKYTHIEPETFNVTGIKFTDTVYNILQDSLRFFMEVEEAKMRIFDAVIDCIDDEMITQFYIETQQPLDEIASHYEILSYMITSLTQTAKDNTRIYMDVKGKVNARLQYGSDGDMSRDDGFEMKKSFPFSSTIVASYKNMQGDVHIEMVTMKIDNSEFYE